MFDSKTRYISLPVIVSVLLLAGCDQSDKATDETSVLNSADTILKYVPADTPYVLANVEPLPDALLDKLEPKIERLLQAYQIVLREIVAAKHADDPDSQVPAIVDELASLLSIDGMRAAGLSRDATGVFYGNGLLPVLRIETSDGALFDAMLSRVEESAGHQLPVASIGDYSYRYVDADKVKIIIAVLDNQAVFTVVPSSSDTDQISQALGLTLPAESIADSGVLQTLAREYGFTDHYVGFIDNVAIAEAIIGGGNGKNTGLMALMERDSAGLSDVCRAEILSLAGIAPRIVLGYTEVSLESLRSTAVVEFRADIAAGLQQLPNAIPGLGIDQGGLMSFGLGINVKAAREFIEARLESLEAEPFECDYFAGLQQGVAGARKALSQPIAPMIYDFKGFLAVVDDIQGLDIATRTPPTSIDASFLLAMDNAQTLVSLGTMFSPELAALNLQPDGKSIELELPTMQAMEMSAHVALTKNAVAVSVGADSATEVEEMLTAEVMDPPPLISFSVDAERYYGFLGNAIAASKQDQEDAASPEMQAALKDVMQAVADLYDRMTANVLLTERGLEIESSVTLSD